MTEDELLEWLYADLDEIIDMVGEIENDKLRAVKDKTVFNKAVRAWNKEDVK